MAFTVIEWFVLVFLILGIIKLLFLVFNAKAWSNFAKKLYSNGTVLFLVELVLAAVLFYYMLQSMTIVMILAGVVLGALLTGMSFALYPKEVMTLASKIMGKGMWKKIWLPVIIWLVLFVWGLVALF